MNSSGSITPAVVQSPHVRSGDTRTRPSARYYLVSAVGPCGQAVSTAGFGFDGVTRPRIPDGTGCR